jgi:hypothetical protein
VDIEKAYDTVWTQGLLFKLLTYNFPAYLITFLHSYLTGRSFAVVVDGAHSSCKTQVAGLPQGAVLCPILFTLYIADIPRLPHVQLALYAHDTAVFTKSWHPDTISRRLNQAADRLIKYFTRWRLRVNTAKTQAIIFTKRRPLPPERLCIDGKEIPWSTEVHYLGLQLTTTLTFTAHVRRAAQTAIGRLPQLFPLLDRDSTLAVDTKRRLYQASIRSALTYAVPVWCSTSTSNYQILQTVQNKCLRVISNSPRNIPILLLHTNLGIDLFKHIFVSWPPGFMPNASTIRIP